MLSTTAQYALRALGCLASRGDGVVVLGRELAEETGVPASYLSKVLLVLNRAGLVEATRGTGGGYRLAKPPEEIALIEIVGPIDDVGRLEECLMGLGECSEQDPCAMHDWWHRVRRDYLEMLRQTSLADVTRKEGSTEARTEMGDDQ
ncbi:MAG: Rrf2 family transcriptional regulator [Thermoanaerobaculia bacterium]